MPPYLERREGQCCYYYFPCGGADSVAEGGDMLFQGGEEGTEPGEKDAECCDKGELDKGQGCGFGEGVEDAFRGGVG